jgi:hypothetical protein
MPMNKSSKNQASSKLKLNQETIRIVGNRELGNVAGGVPSTSWGSDSTLSRVGCCEK